MEKPVSRPFLLQIPEYELIVNLVDKVEKWEVLM